MEIFVAGATGAIGQRLVPRLVAAGHHVVATTRSPAKAGLLRALGAEPAIMDGLDPVAVGEAVGRAQPEVVIHQMTQITLSDMRHFDREFARHQPAAHRGHRQPARGGHGRRRPPFHRGELRRVARQPHRRAGAHRG